MKRIFQHQLDQFLTYLSWATGWAADTRPAVIKCYTIGCSDTAGHLLACWLVKVAGMDGCETAVGLDILFKKAGEQRSPEQVERRIKKLLESRGIEVVRG